MPTKPEFTFRYKVRNWPEYNRALIRRGQLTLWFDEAAVTGWQDVVHGGGRGRPKCYADTAIEYALVLKCVFHLSLRATQGFLESIAKMMHLYLQIPNYSTVCRRQKSLAVHLPLRMVKDARHIVIDSTGLKVYGAGEWHVRKHRTTRRRVWRKRHLGVDETSKEVVAVELTPNSVHDGEMLPNLLVMVPDRIDQVSGDRAYDTEVCYRSILDRGADPTILPRRNATLSKGADPPAWRVARDGILRQVQKQGHYAWRLSSGCTRQSLAENAMYRFKTLLGGRLSARTLENQQVEAMTKCAVLNRMAALGLPESVRVL